MKASDDLCVTLPPEEISFELRAWHCHLARFSVQHDDAGDLGRRNLFGEHVGDENVARDGQNAALCVERLPSCPVSPQLPA